MRLIIVVLSLFSLLTAQPCQDYACDSAVVRAILDLNDLDSVLVEEVTDTANGRISVLNLDSRGLDTLPDEIGNLSALDTLRLRSNNLRSLPLSITGLKAETDVVSNFLCVIEDSIAGWMEEYWLCEGFCVNPIFMQNCTAIRRIGAQGGVVFKDPLKLEVPAGAVNEDINFYLSEGSIGVTPESGFVFLFNPITVSSGGTAYQEAVKISLTWPLDTNGLQLFYLEDRNDSTWEIIDQWIYSGGILEWTTLKPGTFVVGKTDGISNIQTFPLNTLLGLSVFPNPFNPSVTISIPNTHTGKGLIRIYDIRGKIIYQNSEVRGQQIVWNAAGMPSGVYVVKATVGEKIYTRKLCLQR